MAARRPSPQWSHIGPGPGLIDEDQPLRFDAILIFCPLDAPTRHVGTIAFASHHAFFDAELLGMDKLPHRAIVDLQSALAKLGNEPGNVKSLALIRCDNQAACSPEIAFGL